MRAVDGEVEAIGALRAGDREGLVTLRHLYQARAVRVAYAITGELEDAKDAASEAFVKLWLHIDQFDPIRPFGPWFLRIVTNEALKTVKKSKRVITGPSAHEVLSSVPARSDDDPVTLVERRELGRLMEAAMANLCPPDRAVIALRYYADLDERGVAQALGWSLGQVKIRLVRARRRLRKQLMRRPEDILGYLQWEGGQ